MPSEHLEDYGGHGQNSNLSMYILAFIKPNIIKFGILEFLKVKLQSVKYFLGMKLKDSQEPSRNVFDELIVQFYVVGILFDNKFDKICFHDLYDKVYVHIKFCLDSVQ